MGKTVLLNGKDLTGNLGSRTINGDVYGQATLGNQSPIVASVTNYYSIALTVGITLAATLTLGAAGKVIGRRRKRPRR